MKSLHISWMKRTQKLIFALIGILFIQFSFGQRISGTEAEKKVTGAQRILLNYQNQSIEAVFLAPTSYPISSLALLNAQLFGENPDNSWKLIRSENDQIGMTHVRYQQLYQMLPVEGNVFVYHSKNGFFQSANGDFEPNIKLSIEPKITNNDALNAALNDSLIQLKEENLAFKSDELVVFVKNHLTTLAYKINVLSKVPHVNKTIYVDANSGKVLAVINKICTTDAIGVGHTQFSGVQPVVTNEVSPTNFLSTETGRGSGIQTLNASTAAAYVDNDNNWNNVNVDLDEYAMDVHFGAEATYDFYLNNFNRDSYDNAAGEIINYVNDGTVGLNAYWSGSPENAMHYGNGDGDHFPVASLEIAGHELTHGVTENSAALIYADESGALNESFSDIFGNTIRFLNAPSFATWYVGDQLLLPGAPGDVAFRNMSNPNEFQNADCYNGLFFNNGDIVHYDSGIQNFWYYLICTGGTGTNDLGNNYNVAAIGMTDAMTIAYRNLAFYLTPSSTFMDARLGSEQAAIDLFGLCSPQHLAVVHAWYAVGVGANTTSAQVDAQFNISENFSCTAPLSTGFTSNIGYESYAWDFGDGNTSTLQNPAHIYATNGNYTVTLVVTNTLLCPGTDIVTVVDAIVINPVNPLADFSASGLSVGQPTLFTDNSNYNPISWEWNFGDGGTSTLQNPSNTYANPGIYAVQLIVNNCAGADTIVQQIEVYSTIIMCNETSTNKTAGFIYDSGGEFDTYQDYENCTLLIQPCNAATITFTMEQLNIETNYDYLSIYDGPNASAPLLAVYNGMNLQTPVTTTGGVGFIEFTSDQSVVYFGYKIAYTSTPIGGSNNTIADFSASTLTPLPSQNVVFNDLSNDYPQSWAWDFGDGTTSTVQNPTHLFTSNGVYTVTITVTFCGGIVDTQTMLITVGGIGINELESTTSTVIVYPNPTTDVLYIQNSSEWTNVSIDLFDLTGRNVVNEKFATIAKTGIQLNTTDYAPGQYILQVHYLNEYYQLISAQRKIDIQ